MRRMRLCANHLPPTDRSTKQVLCHARDRNVAYAKHTFFINFIIVFAHSVHFSFVLRALCTFLITVGQRSLTDRHFPSVPRSLTVRSLSIVCPFFARSALIRLSCFQVFVYSCVQRSHCVCVETERNGNFFMTTSLQ